MIEFYNVLFPLFTGIFKLILTHKKLGMTKEVMATRVIPFLVPLSIENGLTVTQFNTSC